MSRPTPARIELVAWSWPEVAVGDDLGALVGSCPDLADGDIVVLTSKVVSKAEGRAETIDRADLVARDSVRVVARRGSTQIAQTAHGLVLAGAGVDASNVAPGQALSLPVDPDASARVVRESVLARLGINVAVIVTDTAGRAWRIGQIDIAIGCAGLVPTDNQAGTTDPYGNVLVVTEPVIADEVASAADLVKGKTSGRPMAVLRGLGNAVLPPGEHGAGAASIVRPSASDMFGLGARDAVIAAVRRDQEATVGVPTLAAGDEAPFAGVTSEHPKVRLTVREHRDEDENATGWTSVLEVTTSADASAWLESGRLVERLEVLAWAHGLHAAPAAPEVTSDTAWRAVSGTHWIVA